jgi:hypothetical protein
MKGTDTMATLTDYNQFDGHHYETGTVHNYLAFTGARAPHTRNPYSEALLLGVSGGIVTGYFTFAYKGHDPHVALLTRNSFDPFDTMLSRRGVERDVRQTNKVGSDFPLDAKGVQNLRKNIAGQLQRIHDLEEPAVLQMRDAMS